MMPGFSGTIYYVALRVKALVNRNFTLNLFSLKSKKYFLNAEIKGTTVRAKTRELTLLVGVYGMNFEYIPELKIKYAYFFLLGIMMSVAVFLLLMFRKLKWI